jgi:prepilin-type processing-associated H-X9-DG protein
MAETSTSSTGSRRRSLVAGILIAAVVVFAGLLAQSISRAWAKMSRLDCEFNLRQLSVPCREYAAKHNGSFPSKWSELDLTEDNANWVNILHCPRTYREIGAWTNVDLWADYRLIPGRSTNDPPDTILAIEPLENHASEGANVLFVDGSTAWWPLARVVGTNAK